MLGILKLNPIWHIYPRATGRRSAHGTPAVRVDVGHRLLRPVVPDEVISSVRPNCKSLNNQVVARLRRYRTPRNGDDALSSIARSVVLAEVSTESGGRIIDVTNDGRCSRPPDIDAIDHFCARYSTDTLRRNGVVPGRNRLCRKLN